MRLNQFIAHHSHFSRRDADKLISEGRVKIGQNIAHHGVLVDAADKSLKIFIDGQILKLRKKIPTLIIYHKPKGELVTRRDERNRKVIFDSLPTRFAHFTAVGRLDFASEGLLILSDDKKIVHALEVSSLPRTYLVKISGSVSEKMLDAAQNGLKITQSKLGAHKNSEPMNADFAPFLEFLVGKNSQTFSKIKIKISEGKNREIRRFFAHFDAEVVDLRRISFGFVSLNALPVGKVRFFSKREYQDLREFLGVKSQKNATKSKLDPKKRQK